MGKKNAEILMNAQHRPHPEENVIFNRNFALLLESKKAGPIVLNSQENGLLLTAKPVVLG
jgi:hypothetical protein